MSRCLINPAKGFSAVPCGAVGETPKPLAAPNSSKVQTFTRPSRRAPLQLSGEFSVDELLGLTFVDRPVDFLGRQDIIGEGTSTVIAAREKGGKSTLTRHLCHGWATEGRKVVYFTEEFSRMWQRQLEALEIPRGVGHFQVVEGLDKTPAALLQRAQRGPEDIVVVDTATWLLGMSLASRDDVVTGLKPWVSLCKTGKTVIILAHLTKKGELAGSHAFGAGVDGIITYSEAPGDADLRIVNLKSRTLVETFAIRKTGSAFSLEAAPNEQILTAVQKEVDEVLPVDPKEALTWEEVAAKTGFKEGKTRKILRELVEFRLAADITGNLGSGGRGNAAKYIRLESEET